MRTFGTTTVVLLALRDWLESHGVTHVAMESTGVCWKPVYYLLEAALAPFAEPCNDSIRTLSVAMTASR